MRDCNPELEVICECSTGHVIYVSALNKQGLYSVGEEVGFQV